jgi:predicted DNA-binding protein (MmcQ/YjbR family)
MYASPGNHHGGGRPAVWCKAAPGVQSVMVSADPQRFFVPPYVGKSGWVGIWLDQSPDWDDVKDAIRDSYEMIARKSSSRRS